jgi:ABC-type sugar transport system ATPase subunit
MDSIKENDNIIEVKNLVKQFKKVKAVNDIRFQ